MQIILEYIIKQIYHLLQLLAQVEVPVMEEPSTLKLDLSLASWGHVLERNRNRLEAVSKSPQSSIAFQGL